MKKSFISFIASFVSFVCFAQSEETKPYVVTEAGVSYTRVIPVNGKEASELYSLADNYFTYNYVDANSIVQTQDKEAGTIIGKGLYHEFSKYTDGFGFIYVSAVHILRIDCKDERVRVILTIPNYHLRGIATSSRAAFTRDEMLTDTYPFTGDETKIKAKQKRELAWFEDVNARAARTIQSVEDYFLKSGNTGLENDEW